jgi:PST family polysaccharide transporter
MAESPRLRHRILGFALLPAVAAVSPLIVLPAVSRSAGPDGWASAIAGESIGTFAAIAVAYGWTTVGPSLIAIASDDVRRGRLYRDAVVVRGLTSLLALPALVILCFLVASPGHGWLAALMGLQGALIGLSFTWFSVGVGDPRPILIFDAAPRLCMAALAMVAIVRGAPVEVYPIAGIAVTVVGTTLYSLSILRRYPSAWPPLREVPGLFRVSAPVALNDAALGAYSSVPAPLVNVLATGTSAAGFASGDKMAKLGQFLPLTLANALQTWTAEATGSARLRRLHLALALHGGSGLLGWLVLGLAGPPVSLLLFGADAAATAAVCFALGGAFAMYSLRTSMTRHVLFPAGQQGAVMRATLVATAVGIPAMVAGGITMGPIGAALGYALTEAVSTALLARRTTRALVQLTQEESVG